MVSAAKNVTYIRDHFRSILLIVCTAVGFESTSVIAHESTGRGARSTTNGERARLFNIASGGKHKYAKMLGIIFLLHA